MRKKFLLPLLMLCVGSCFVMTSCKGTGNEPEPTSAEITLSHENVEIQMYQEFLLTAIYEGEETVAWTVADSTVVSVENGKIVGLKAGTTTVTVTAGTLTDTCTVTVSPLDEANLFLQVAEANVSLYKNDQKQIEATIKYYGMVLDESAEKTYQSSDSNVVSVDENGKMTAKEFGDATISVIYTLYGREIATSVNVEVVSSGLVEIAQSSVTLDLEENNTATLTAKAYEKGVENTDASITWSATDGQDVIKMTNGAIKAINAGETTVTATYVGQDGVTKTDSVTVTVDPTIVNVDKKIELWKNEYAGGYPVDELGLDITGEITGGYVVLDGELTAELPFADGKYDISSLSLREMELYVQTRNTIYQMPLTVYERVYLNQSNFKERLTNLGGSASAEFILEENITLEGTWTNAFVFAGSFDGQGHTVSGLKLSDKGGLFNAMENATVKNLALVGVTLGSGSGAFAYTNKTGTTVFENVYVSLSSESEGGNLAGLIADNSVSQNSKITAKNCVVYIPDELMTTSAFVTATTATNNTVTVENCTFVGANGMIVGDNATVTNTNSIVCGVLDAHKTYKVNWLDMQAKAYAQDYKYVELTQANFATHINVEGTITGYYELTENINLGGTYYGKANTFTGTLDGKGHTISGIKAAGTAAKNLGGLFKTLRGTIKDVSIKGTHSERSGMIAHTCDAKALIENVYVETTLLYKDSGAIVYMCAGTLTMKNVVIMVDKANENQDPGAVFAMVSMKATLPTLENCYYIAKDGMNPLGPRSATNTAEYGMLNGGAEAVFGTVKTDDTITDYTVTTYTKEGKTTLTAYTDDTVENARNAFDVAVTAGTVTLNDTLKKLMGYLTTTA